MKFTAHIKRASLAVVMLSSALAYQSAHAAAGETSANTDILNKATVSYSVSSIAQTVIESSPTGNSNPGVGNGTNTSFKVDRKVAFTVAELSGAATSPVNPGQNNVVTAFTLANTGNDAEGFALASANEVGTTLFTHVDNQQMSNLRVFVDSNANGTYESGSDTATLVNTLARDTSVVVFIVADTPLAATNGQYANVQLTATAAVAGTSAATLETQTGGPNTAGVDVVFVGSPDGSGHLVRTASDQYAIVSAALTVTKTSTLISDPINGTGANRLNIPGAVVEYTITVANGGATQADLVGISDQLDTNLTFQTGGMSGADIEIVVSGGGGTTTCTAATDGDGCSVTGGGLLTVGTTSRPNIAAGQNATIKFRVTIK